MRKLDLLVEQGEHGHGVHHPAVHADDGDGPAPSHQFDGQVQGTQPVDAELLHERRLDPIGQQPRDCLHGRLQGRAVRFHTYGVDDGIRSTALRMLPDRRDHLVVSL